MRIALSFFDGVIQGVGIGTALMILFKILKAAGYMTITIAIQ